MVFEIYKEISMKYITLSDLSKDIRKNVFKIRHDIDFIIGIPRSGMIVAGIIAEYLNVPVIDIDSFCSGCKATGGNRLTLIEKKDTKNVLVVDDTCFSGASIKAAKDKLKQFEYNFIYGVCYLEGPGVDNLDFWLEDVRGFTNNFKNIVLYEWNIFNHYPFIMQRCMYDIDGVLCLDPPDERNTEQYEEYIKDATPMYIPKVPIGSIVTFRLNKYRDITEEWLKKNGVKYNNMCMFNAGSWEERNNTGVLPEQFKAAVYKSVPYMMLFVESDDRQAKEIHRLTGKAVLSIEANKLYS